MDRIAFRKMHGLGNDFVVVDLRAGGVEIGPEGARNLADRRTGIGCDQVILLEKPQRPAAQVFMRIRNPDGSEAEACGNATRCIASLIGAETGDPRVRIETIAGLLEADLGSDGLISVDMGEPRTDWRDIPLAQEADTLRVDLTRGPLAEPICTNIGNPHATFFVPDADAIDLAALGPLLEHDKLFPQRANIGVATVRDRETIRLRVWERAAGITLACGSGACAALVAAARRGLTGRQAVVLVDGGRLDIAWRDDGHVVMTGPAVTSFEGWFDAALLGES
jgi:diaminopimelate epimerase